MDFLLLVLAVAAVNCILVLFAVNYSPLRQGIRQCCRVSTARPGALDEVLRRVFRGKEAAFLGQLHDELHLKAFISAIIITQNVILIFVDIGPDVRTSLMRRTGILAMINMLAQCFLAIPEPCITRLTSLCKGQLLWVHTLLSGVATFEMGVHSSFALFQTPSPQDSMSKTTAMIAVGVGSCFVVVTAVVPRSALQAFPPLRMICRTPPEDHYARLTWRRFHAVGGGLSFLFTLLFHVAPARLPTVMTVISLVAVMGGLWWNRCLWPNSVQFQTWDSTPSIDVELPQLQGDYHDLYRISGAYATALWVFEKDKKYFARFVRKPGARDDPEGFVIEGPFHLPVPPQFLQHGPIRIICRDMDAAEAFLIERHRKCLGLHTYINCLDDDNTVLQSFPRFGAGVSDVLEKKNCNLASREIICRDMPIIALGDLKPENFLTPRIDFKLEPGPNEADI